MYNGNMKNKLPRKYRNVGRLYQADNDDRRSTHQHTSKVRRSDAPENIVSLRYVGMHNGVAGDAKMAETLVLSGFTGGGLSKPHAAFAHTVCSYTWEPAKDERPPLRHPAAVSWRTKKSRHLAGWTQSTLTHWTSAKE